MHSFSIPENDVLQIEGVFYDASCGDSDAEDVLNGGQIIRRWYPVDRIKITESGNKTIESRIEFPLLMIMQ